ncbi:Conserved phage C-terminus [Popillia japonica]|uniref:Conserved phage C-terminus n=1 Tax=Popillia japonica TaxID=7064 RepID=A0AAW1HW48_POPJA
MAERRMFSKTIIDSDAFLDMPLSTQSLYFHLSMRGDDEGFINNPRKIQKMIGASEDDLKLLIAKGFIIPFESGVVVIKHWKIHNYIRGDRKKATTYSDEKKLLEEKENGAYTLKTEGLQEIKEPEETALTKRQSAFKKSELAYSFMYKIRNAFIGCECPICGAVMQRDIEDGIATNNRIPSIQHNVPISKGGKHELGNISIICKQCNIELQDTVTGGLNADEVAEKWLEICEKDQCQSLGGHMSVTCPADVSIGKVRLGKVSIGKKEHIVEQSPTVYPYIDVIAYLNQAAGKRFKHASDKTKGFIKARINEGFTLDDFKRVIDTKVAEWGNNPDMKKKGKPMDSLEQTIQRLREMTAQSEDSCGEKLLPDKQEDPKVCSICNGTGFKHWRDEEGHFFADPCECQKEILKQRRLSFAEIPEKYKDATLETFSISAYESPKSKDIARQACKGIKYYLDNFNSLKSAGMGLYIHSNTKGSGKTRMAASVANHIMQNTTLQARFATSTRIITEIQSIWDDKTGTQSVSKLLNDLSRISVLISIWDDKTGTQSVSKLLNDLSRISVLIIDDFGTEIHKAWVEEKFYQIINERYINNLPTIFTSNCRLEQLKYDDRITNRIEEKTFQIAFPEESVRKAIKRKNHEAIKRKNHEELIENITK